MSDQPTLSPELIIRICPICLQQFDGSANVCPDDGVPLRQLTTEQEDPLLGETIDKRWHVLEKLGQGGMGSVYVADQLNMERRVALKTLHGKLENQTEYIQRFLREARVASKVSHPNLVAVYDFGQTPKGMLYIVMELLLGESLSISIEKKNLTLRGMLSIGAQLCAGLYAAHEAGIIHRDLKPDNIQLVPLGSGDILAKVLDFGIARQLDSVERATQTGQVFGTPGYMSPEQCQGIKGLDAKADLYALGCILFEMMTGRPPFYDESVLKTMMQHMSEPLPTLVPKQQERVLEPLVALVEELLAKEAKDRPKSAQEVRDRLLAIDDQIKRVLEDISLPFWTPFSSPTVPQGEDTARLPLLQEQQQKKTRTLLAQDLFEAPPEVDSQETLLHLPEKGEVDQEDPVRTKRPVLFLALIALCLLGAGLVAFFATDRTSVNMKTIVANIESNMPAPLPKQAGVDSDKLVNSLATLTQRQLAERARQLAVTYAFAPSGQKTPKKRVKNTPPVRVKTPLVSGSRTRASFQKTVKSLSKKSRRCVDEAIKRAPQKFEAFESTKLRINLRYTIDPKGDVTSVKASSTGIQDARMIRCVEEVVKKGKFLPYLLNPNSAQATSYFSYNVH